jgi:hypothetical protein
LDREYPDGRHRDDVLLARWRLQLLAELNVGMAVRQQQVIADGKLARMKQRASRGTR